MTHERQHLAIAGAGMLCLLALACLLWGDDAPPEIVAPIPVDPAPAPIPAALARPGAAVPTFDSGRTTIKPLISDAALQRRRMH
jgi:hypothetical protein